MPRKPAPESSAGAGRPKLPRVQSWKPERFEKWFKGPASEWWASHATQWGVKLNDRNELPNFSQYEFAKLLNTAAAGPLKHAVSDPISFNHIDISNWMPSGRKGEDESKRDGSGADRGRAGPASGKKGEDDGKRDPKLTQFHVLALVVGLDVALDFLHRKEPFSSMFGSLDLARVLTEATSTGQLPIGLLDLPDEIMQLPMGLLIGQIIHEASKRKLISIHQPVWEWVSKSDNVHTAESDNLAMQLSEYGLNQLGKHVVVPRSVPGLMEDDTLGRLTSLVDPAATLIFEHIRHRWEQIRKTKRWEQIRKTKRDDETDPFRFKTRVNVGVGIGRTVSPIWGEVVRRLLCLGPIIKDDETIPDVNVCEIARASFGSNINENPINLVNELDMLVQLGKWKYLAPRDLLFVQGEGQAENKEPEILSELDVVFTTPGKYLHEHAALFWEMSAFDRNRVRNEKLQQVKCKLNEKVMGDILLNPYSNKRPLSRNDIKEEFAGYRQRIQQDPSWKLIDNWDKLKRLGRSSRSEGERTDRKEPLIMLVVGPCGVGTCTSTSKSEALLPFITVPELAFFSHLITDAITAKEVLDEDEVRSLRSTKPKQ